jgi:hypothetical protein
MLTISLVVHDAGAFEHHATPSHTSAVVERQQSAEPQGYKAVARISVLVRRLSVGLVFDELPGGNHRRGPAGATLGGAACGAYKFAIRAHCAWVESERD